MSKKIAIFGCSGFALEVADVCYLLDYEEILLLAADDDHPKSVNGLDVVSEGNVELLFGKGFSFAIGIGDPSVRRKIYEKYNKLSYPNLIHPSVCFGLNQKNEFKNKLGNIVTAGVIFTNSIEIGNFGVYNINSTIGHDCIIGNFVSIMPGVCVSGNVSILEGAFLGVSSTILQGSQSSKLVVGRHSIVGACSLVTKSVSDDVTVFGVPAKKIKSNNS